MKKYLLFVIFTFQFSPDFTGIQSFAQSWNINLLYNWDDTTIVSTIWYDNTYNEVWGFVQDGREYAVIGSTAGTHIFDVTDPYNVDTADFIPGAAQGTNIVHRDFHDYNGYLYIVSDEGNSTLQIIDLSYLPDSAFVVYDSDALFARSHNIFIDTATARLYTCGGNNNNGIRVFSLADPVNPVELVNFFTSETAHDIYVRNDTAFMNNGTSGLFIYDFTNVTNPQLIGSLTTYPDQGYNHSGWLSKDGNVYAFADETWGMDLKICAVSDLMDITVLSQLNSEVDSSSIAHNLIFKDNYLFVSYYYDGLQIFDISDPYNPVKTGYYDTYPLANGLSYKGNWGVYPSLPSGIVLISDMQSGLFVFDVSQAVGIEGKRDTDNPINVFPNPFRESITVSLPDNFNSNLTLELFDILGRRILSESQLPSNSNKYIIKTDNLQGGIYILKVTPTNSGQSGQDVFYYQKLIKI